MLANRQTLEAGVETEFLFDDFASNTVLVKNETLGAVLFCDGVFDSDAAASIPALSWQMINITVRRGDTPKYTVKADVAGEVEIDFGSLGMGALCYQAFDAAGMIPHTLTLTVGADTTLAATLIRLHGETLDLDTPVSLTSGATVFSGDVVELSATATGEGFHSVLLINSEEVELTDGAATLTVSGDTVAATAAVEDEGA